MSQIALFLGLDNQNFKNYSNLNLMAKLLFSTFIIILLLFRQNLSKYHQYYKNCICQKKFQADGLRNFKDMVKIPFFHIIDQKTSIPPRSCHDKEK